MNTGYRSTAHAGLWLLTALLFSLTFRSWNYTDEFFFRALSPPTEWLRENGYGISGMLLILVAAYYSYRGPAGSFRMVWTPMYVQLAPVIIFRLKLNFENGETKGMLLSLALAVTVAVCFGASIPSALRCRILTSRGINLAIFATGILWSGVSLFEWEYNEAAVVWNTRFQGIAGHPNHAGLLLAICGIVGVGLAVIAERKAIRVLYAIGALIMLLLIYWTASRTAVVVFVVGVTALILERRRAVVIIALMMAAVCGTILSGMFMQAPDSMEDIRVVSTQNTRLEVWENLWTTFTKNVGIGAGETVVGSESSVLLILARTGLVGGIPFAISCWLMLREAYRMLGCREGEKRVTDPRIAGAIIIAVLAGGVFEGYLKDEFSFPIYTVYLLLVSGKRFAPVSLPVQRRMGEFSEVAT